MDTDALRWLQQVTDGTTLTEVSELESVTQSGVSRALARLEAQIGTPLLRRSGRTLRMTHAGAVFKPHLDALLHHLDDGIAAVNQLIDPDTGVVALAFQGRVRLAEVASEPFIGLRAASALRRLTDELCEQAGFRPDVIFEGDDLSNVRGFVAAGLGVAVVPAPRAGSPEAVPGPVAYLEIGDQGAVREIFLTWSAACRLLPATDLFRRHVLRRAGSGRLPAVSE